MYDNESHLIDVDPQRIYRHSPKFKILENTLPYGVCLWAYQLQLDTHKTRMTIHGRTGQPGICQVGRLVFRPGGPPRQLLK